MKPTSINATSICIERRPKRISLRAPHAAPLIPGLRSRAVGAPHHSPRDRQRGCIGGGERAAGVGVYGCLIVGVVVDAFDDVDFTARGPVRAVCPDCVEHAQVSMG